MFSRILPALLEIFAGATNHLFGDRNFPASSINQGGALQMVSLVAGRLSVLGLHDWLLRLCCDRFFRFASPLSVGNPIVVSGYDSLMNTGSKSC